MKKLGTLLLSCFILACGSAIAIAKDKTYDVDIVIVGAGAGGMTAGMVAVENGLKTLILEKMPGVGGGGNYMEGTFAVESSVQKADNIGVTAERQFRRVMDFHHWRINGKVLNHWLKQTAPTIEWLMSQGIQFEGVKTAFIDGNRTWHMFEGGHGSSLIKLFYDKITAQGGTILTETSAQELIIKDGQVVGVIAENADGEKIIVNAKAVVIATGGFSANEEMIAQYLPYAGYKFAGPAGRTGDGVKMLESAGAQLVNMNVVMQAGLWLKDVPTDLQFGKDGITKAKYVRLLAALNQPYLLVSPRGERVVDETQPLEYISNAFEEVGGEGFMIFDEDTKLEMQNVGLIRGYFGMVTPMRKFDDFDALFAEGVQQGFAFKANTLDELAKMTGMDAATLKQTADEMNKMVAQGKDEQFYKDAQWLRPVTKGPFYAIKGALRMYATTGGSRVNENFQAINKEGQIIPGIYAIGQDAGGMYSDSYDMHIAEGTASSWAITGGRLAALHIAGVLKK